MAAMSIRQLADKRGGGSFGGRHMRTEPSDAWLPSATIGGAGGAGGGGRWAQFFHSADSLREALRTFQRMMMLAVERGDDMDVHSEGGEMALLASAVEALYAVTGDMRTLDAALYSASSHAEYLERRSSTARKSGPPEGHEGQGETSGRLDDEERDRKSVV